MSDTPETDAAEDEWRDSSSRKSGREEMADIARKMERERDEARAEAERWRDNWKHRGTMSMIVSTKLPWEFEILTTKQKPGQA